jgi:O-antigen/teichoic acid export membrane protein
LADNTPIIDSLAEPEIPSTAGMTTKVVKGSIWTLAGQVLPLMAALVSTPFVIRFLGSEAYGVLILVGLIPGYFAFADFGMGIASTKFGSEAYGRGKKDEEAGIVRTAALIGLLTTLVFALPIFIFSHTIIAEWFQVPEHLQYVGSIALKITSASFVFGIMSSIFNTPMLARLRMDLNTLVNALPKVLMSLATPVVLYLGGHLVEAVWIAFFAAVLIFGGTVVSSGRLLPALYGLTINKEVIPKLFKFGGGWIIAMIAAILLINVEKILLARFVSVKALAFYSIAFTFANMAAMFSSAMIQSLIPAFSQLLTPEKRPEFENLFSRTIKLNLIWVFPMIMVMFVVAKPFFTVWAGPEFGRESSLPFYILLVGLFFNIFAYIPHSIITSTGRTDILAKLYWIELVLYLIGAVILIKAYGIAGAAAVWSLRVFIDAFLVIWMSNRIAGISLNFLGKLYGLLGAVIFLIPPIGFVVLYGNFSLWLIPLTLISLLFYLLIVWNMFVDENEREWIQNRIKNLLRFN